MKKFEEFNRNEDQPTESEENNDEGSDVISMLLIFLSILEIISENHCSIIKSKILKQ